MPFDTDIDPSLHRRRKVGVWWNHTFCISTLHSEVEAVVLLDQLPSEDLHSTSKASVLPTYSHAMIKHRVVLHCYLRTLAGVAKSFEHQSGPREHHTLVIVTIEIWPRCGWMAASYDRQLPDCTQSKEFPPSSDPVRSKEENVMKLHVT